MATNNAINLTASGVVAYDGSGTFAGRTLTAGSSKIDITNGDGTAGNPTIDATEANFTLDNIGGTLSVSKGGTGATSQTAYAVLCGGTSSTNPYQSIAGVGSSGEVLTSNGAGALPTFQSAGTFPWTEVTGTTQSMAVNNAYVANNASEVTFTLPDTAAIGDVVEVQGYGAGLFTIEQNASEIIHFGSSDTTTGTGGNITATHRYDSVRLVCVVANTEWATTHSVGNFTIV
jgi:hypothetical protein